MNEPLRVLGVDTALRSSGVGVVEARGSRLAAVEFGTIRNPKDRPHSECLRCIHDEVAAVLERTRPHAVAVEGGFYFKNARTAMVLGEARGVVIAVCSCAGLPVYEYSPRRVKQALVGTGAAHKQQVAHMVVSLLGLQEEPQEDASDALGIAVCHLHNHTRHASLRPEPI